MLFRSLPIESANDLQQLLISSMTKRKDTKQYQTQNLSNSSKGKQITTISNIRQQIIKLTQKCEFMMEPKKTNTTSTVDLVPVNNEDNDNGSDCKTSEPKKQSKINEMIDFFNQPSYMKKELPSLQLRENSANLERDSRFKYRRLVHMGYRMISSVFDILCPGTSRRHVLNDICVRLSKQTNKCWNSLDHSTVQVNYTKLVSTLCLCLKIAKKNTIEKKSMYGHPI